MPATEAFDGVRRMADGKGYKQDQRLL